MSLEPNLFISYLPALANKKDTRLMTVSLKKVRVAKSRPGKNQSNRSDLPQDYQVYYRSRLVRDMIGQLAGLTSLCNPLSFEVCLS